MKININYIDNELNFDNKSIVSFEIRNKKYLYRIISLFYSLANGDVSDEIICTDDKNEEIKLTNKIRVFTNYIDFGFSSKQYSNDLVKYLTTNIEEFNTEKITKIYNKLCMLMNKELNKTDIPLYISNDGSIENILKFLKISIKQQEELLNNLLLLIDLENLLKLNKILCFINLKQYLSKEELLEFYKYATYNSIKVIMIESNQYDYIKEFENIIVIDDNLDEFMIEYK